MAHAASFRSCFRFVRAAGGSLLLHGAALAAILEGPARPVALPVTASVSLDVAWREDAPASIEAQGRPEAADLWEAPLLELERSPEGPPLLPPVVEVEFMPPAEIGAAPDASRQETPVSAYWRDLRSMLARDLAHQRIAGATNVAVHLYATEAGLIPLEPRADAAGAAGVVRAAIERIARSERSPPPSEIGRGMRLAIRFEPEP